MSSSRSPAIDRRGRRPYHALATGYLGIGVYFFATWPMAMSWSGVISPPGTGAPPSRCHLFGCCRSSRCYLAGWRARVRGCDIRNAGGNTADRRFTGGTATAGAVFIEQFLMWMPSTRIGSSSGGYRRSVRERIIHFHAVHQPMVEQLVTKAVQPPQPVPAMVQDFRLRYRWYHLRWR